MVGTYDSLGKRPSARPQLGRPGTNEEALAGYAGARQETYTYFIAAGVTNTTANPFGARINRIVDNVAIGTPGTSRALTLVTVPALVATGSTVTSQARSQIPYPMALVAVLTAAAAPTGTHQATIRVYGTNQFGEPIQEDFVMSAAAGGGSGNVLGAKPFKTISSVVLIAETNTSASDQIDVFFSPATNGIFGLPARCRAPSDLTGLVINVVGVARADILSTGAGPTFVNVANQTFTTPSQGYIDNVDTYLHITCRTSLGMDQGARSGDKFQKNY